MTEQLFKTDDGNAVLRFFEEAPKNNFLSEQQGVPIFDTALMCEVITPGQNASTLTIELERTLNSVAGLDEDGKRKVKRTGQYKRFEKQIEAYKGKTGEYVDDGTPIQTWAQIDRGQAMTLKALGIHTVEALASVADSALQNLGHGGRTLRDQAVSYLTSRQFGLPDAQNTAKLTKLEQENELLKQELAELKSLLTVEAANTAVGATQDLVPATEEKALV